MSDQERKDIMGMTDETAKKIYRVLQAKGNEAQQLEAMSDMTNEELDVLIQLLTVSLSIMKKEEGR